MISLKRLVPVALMIIVMPIASVASAQYYHDEKLDRFLDGHPKVKSELAQNPDLIYNKQWREKHPELRQFMQNHPNAWGKLSNSERYGAPGANPSMYQKHPEGTEARLNSAGNDDQNAKWSKRHEREEAKETKYHQDEQVNAEAKAEHPHKNRGHGHD